MTDDETMDEKDANGPISIMLCITTMIRLKVGARGSDDGNKKAREGELRSAELGEFLSIGLSRPVAEAAFSVSLSAFCKSQNWSKSRCSSNARIGSVNSN